MHKIEIRRLVVADGFHHRIKSPIVDLLADRWQLALELVPTLVEERERNLYQATNEEVEDEKRSFCEFVALGAKKEKETGEPVLVIASLQFELCGSCWAGNPLPPRAAFVVRHHRQKE